MNLMKGLKSSIVNIADILMTKNSQLRLARFFLNRCNCDNDGNPHSNGEYRLLNDVKSQIDDSKNIVFDVGANVGEWTAELATQCSKNISIYAFEPSTDTFAQLEKNLARFSDKNITIKCIHSALGDHRGSATLFKQGKYAGTNTLLEPKHNKDKLSALSTEVISIMTGDQFCDEYKIEFINFIKIDTEGSEISALSGFSTMIERQQIGCIQFEYGGSWIDARKFLLDAFQILSGNHYEIGKICPKGIRWFPKYDQRLESFQYSNFVAATPEYKAFLKSF